MKTKGSQVKEYQEVAALLVVEGTIAQMLLLERVYYFFFFLRVLFYCVVRSIDDLMRPSCC